MPTSPSNPTATNRHLHEDTTVHPETRSHRPSRPVAAGPVLPAAAPVARRRLLAGAGALLAGGVLAACAPEPEPPAAPPSGPPAGAPTPVTSTEQFEEVVTEIHEAVTTADEARDAALLAPRVTGSAVEFRTTAYGMIAKAEEWAEDLKTPGAELIVPMYSVGTEFPRVAIALVSDSAEEGVPYFVALQQADARSPYASWGWAQQAVGIDMPMVPHEKVGSEPVGPEETGLLRTPAEALALYAKVLSDGDEGDPEDLLAPNPFQTVTHERIQAERAELNAGVEKDEAATIKEVYSVKEGEFAGLRTDDGGAIVMGTLLSTRTVDVKDGATMRYAEDNKYTKLIGKKEFTDVYERTYGTTVALYVPPADSGRQIQPIGGTQTALGATGS